eukprot:201002_1
MTSTANILVLLLSCFPFIARGLSDGDRYIDTYQLLEDPNSMLLTISAWNIPNFVPYCKLLNVNDGTVSDVVSCSQNTREWPISDIDPSFTSISSVRDNHDGTADVFLSRNRASVYIRDVPYASSLPINSTYASTQIHCDQFTLNSVHTTFVGLGDAYGNSDNPEVILITFKSATDNSRLSVSNLGRVIPIWDVWSPNTVVVYEDAHAIDVYNDCKDWCFEVVRVIARYELEYVNGVVSGIQIESPKGYQAKVDPLAEKSYDPANYDLRSFDVYDLSTMGGAHYAFYELDLTYTTSSPTNIPSVSPTYPPTLKPTPNPTLQPTESPTLRPSMTPTRAPTKRPTSFPSKTPTQSPSNYPSTNPTSSPTKPRLLCGGDNVGTYTEGQITFDVTMPYDGEMIFDASGSNFNVTSIQMYNASGGLLGNDSDNDGEIMIHVIAGDYTIDIEGSITGTSIYHVDLVCASSQPTKHRITPHPSFRPTTKLIAILETSLSNYSASSTTNTAYGVATPNDIIAYFTIQNIVLGVLLFSTLCCCCCVAGLVYKCRKRKRNVQAIAVNIQMRNEHEVHHIVPCDVDFEREMVASWMRYTVQLPQYVHLFISQGFETMQSIQCIECAADLHALGIQNAFHQTLILTEIKRLQGTDFVVKGLTHGTDVVTMDDGQGHATKPAALRPPPPPQASPSFLSDDSDSDDSLVTSPKGKQKQKHHEDFWTVEGE